MAGFCPTTSIQTFPNTLSLPSQNVEFYTKEATYEPTNIEFQWAEQRTAATFFDSLKGIISLPEGLSNTLRYNGTTFTLSKLQLTDPTHTSWVLPVAAQADNKEDLIFTFTPSSSAVPTTGPAQILIVVPILRSSTATTTDPNFFKMMTQGASYNFANPASLREFFPAATTTTVTGNTIHLYYQVCAAGTNSLIVVQTYGYRISDALMESMLSVLNSVTRKFGPYDPIQGTPFPTTKGVIDEADTKTSVKYGYRLGERVETQPAPTAERVSVVPVDAYKCVPFDPDTQLEDGKIRVNLETGEPISKLEEEREAARADTAQPVSSALAKSETFVKITTVGIGSLLAIGLFFTFLYLVFGAGDEGTGWWARFAMKLSNYMGALTWAVLAGFVGVVVGLSLR
jgi:hypothetical protein